MADNSNDKTQPKTAIDTDEMRMFMRNAIADEISSGLLPLVERVDKLAEEVAENKKAMRSLATRKEVERMAREQAEQVFSERADMLKRAVDSADSYVRTVEGKINNTDGLLISLRDLIKDLRKEMREQDNKSDSNSTKIALLQSELSAPGEHSFSGRLGKIEELLEALPGALQAQFAQENTKMIQRIEPLEKYVSEQKAAGQRLKEAVLFIKGSPKWITAIVGGGAALGSVITAIIEYLKATGVIQ